jgi:outer membrane protein OmpA-like peptidoglycan-associated protein
VSYRCFERLLGSVYAALVWYCPAATQAEPTNPEICQQALARAAKLGLPDFAASTDQANDEHGIHPRWRLAEVNVSFPSDEFDQAQVIFSTTHYFTGKGIMQLTFSSHFWNKSDQLNLSTSGGIALKEPCAPSAGQERFTCTFEIAGHSGCLSTIYHLPPIGKGQIGQSASGSVYSITIGPSTTGLIEPGARTRMIVTVPGDYSKNVAEPGGHQLKEVVGGEVTTNFVYNPETGSTEVVVVNNNVTDRTGLQAVKFAIFGSRLRVMSDKELLSMIEQNGRAVLHINFDFDKSNLKSDARPAIDQVIVMLKERPRLLVTVEGHTDNKGTSSYNQRLSEARAESVKHALIAAGIDASRLSTQGMGATQPIADNTSDDGRFKNRRVEITRR